ncbi:hypothetical protein [Paenibacillus hamazuiensis]|uniref:hypothetical protein n=1 Tax=Paenibacillus hamazuiensis TaxID=2936508 RepID=UPI00200CE492|nr:hypothetical protein [Paenibacillus hamazuiensis]
MDGIVWFFLALIVLTIVFRLRFTYRKFRKLDRGEQIQERLRELRKKRDED